MTDYNQIQPLESYRLGAYQLPIPCYLCGSGNLFDGQWCRECSGPLEMTRIVGNQESFSRPQIVATLGASNVGKTVYLGMLLDILARQNEELEFTTCDAATVAMQQKSISVLARGHFPESTYPMPENWQWAHCRMKRRTSKIAMETFLLDMSGSSLMEEIEHRRRFPVVSGMITKATGLMVLVDAERVSHGDKDEEFFALSILGHVQDVLTKHQHVLAEAARAETKKSRGQRHRPTKSKGSQIPPLAVIQMKADTCPECFDNPAEHARSNMPGLWQFCKDRFPNHRFFAASAVGACALMPSGRNGVEKVPVRVEPRGIMAPFRWLISQFTP